MKPKAIAIREITFRIEEKTMLAINKLLENTGYYLKKDYVNGEVMLSLWQIT